MPRTYTKKAVKHIGVSQKSPIETQQEDPYTMLALGIISQACIDLIDAYNGKCTEPTKVKALCTVPMLEKFFQGDTLPMYCKTDGKRLIQLCREQAKAEKKKEEVKARKQRVKDLHHSEAMHDKPELWKTAEAV